MSPALSKQPETRYFVKILKFQIQTFKILCKLTVRPLTVSFQLNFIVHVLTYASPTPRRLGPVLVRSPSLWSMAKLVYW